MPDGGFSQLVIWLYGGDVTTSETLPGWIALTASRQSAW